MNITECFPMRKRRSIDKTPGRSHGDARAFLRSPVGRLRHTPHRPASSSCNNSFSDQSLEIVWDNNSPSPARTLSLGKRKKHYSSDSSSSGGEISDLVQKLADKSGQTPDANPPLLALWMSREASATVQKVSGNGTVNGNSAAKQKSKEFQTPSRRPRRVLRKCNKSKMKLLKQDIEQLCNQLEKTEEDVENENCNKISTSGDAINFFDGWDTDEEDMILSQVEIPCFTSKIAETQIMTNTQLLDSGEDNGREINAQNTLLSKDQEPCTNVCTNDSIVTESWDFVDELGDSEDENILEIALEDFEKSQQPEVTVPTVRRVSHLHVKPNAFHKETNVFNAELLSTEQPGTIAAVVQGRDDSSAFQKNLVAGQKCLPKGTFSFVPHSVLQSTFTAGTTQQEKRPKLESTNSLVSSNNLPQRIGKERQALQHVSAQGNAAKQQEHVKQTTAQKETSAARPSRYSKEEIERKKLEAQNRRKQKVAQSQQKNQK